MSHGQKRECLPHFLSIAHVRMEFEEWNVLLAQHFFNPARAGRRVYLHTTKELLRSVFGKDNAVDDFILAIKAGPPAGGQRDMCAKALTIFKDWRANAGKFPPYIAYLSFFSLAAGHDGDWARHAYYPRVWALLGENHTGAPPHFRQMSSELWHDLQTWTHNDKAGEWGLFKWQSAFDWIYVGLPVAQTILTEEERNALPELFEKADIEPGAVLPEGQLAALIIPVAERRLRRQTLKLLSTNEMSDYRSSLLESIQDELAAWDGTVRRVPGAAEDSRRAGLRTWLKDIDPAGFVESRIVAFLPEGIEAGDLLLDSNSLSGTNYICEGLAGKTSEALRDANSGTELGAEKLDWQRRTEFSCSHTGTKLVLPAAEIRIFASAAPFLTGYIEVRRIPAQGEFLIASSGKSATELDDWGQSCCGGWKEIRVKSGLPSGWRLFSAFSVKTPGGISNRFALLARPALPKIAFKGGIRSGSRAAYFPFALPAISVEWHEPASGASINGQPLEMSDGFLFYLPPELAKPVNTIEAVVGAQQIQAMLFLVSDGWRWVDGSGCAPVDRFGMKALAGSDIQISGALVTGKNSPPFELSSEAAAEENHSAYLLGKVPGQIADLRRGEKLPSWPAIWAVSTSRRTVQFAYCGVDLARSEPNPKTREGNPKQWANLLWVTRKRAETPEHPRVRELLFRYRKVAREI